LPPVSGRGAWRAAGGDLVTGDTPLSDGDLVILAQHVLVEVGGRRLGALRVDHLEGAGLGVLDPQRAVEGPAGGVDDVVVAVGAQLSLGNLYAKGQGVAQDFNAAAAWFAKAAARGEADAPARRDDCLARAAAAASHASAARS
jgi:hypothetical protein